MLRQLFVLFWSMVQLYGIITLHALKVINSIALQKRAVRIILYPTILSYITALGYLKLESPKHRRTVADKKFFNGISQCYNCLHHLLPPPHDTELVTRLRHANKYPIPFTKTKRFCSFINFALANYVEWLFNIFCIIYIFVISCLLVCILFVIITIAIFLKCTWQNVSLCFF